MAQEPVMEALPGSLAELEDLWPRRLKEMAVISRCPVPSDELTAGLRNDRRFMDLVRGWENMPTQAQANAWVLIEDRLWEAVRQARSYCVRCGECCRRGSPVLYEQDRIALAQGAIRPQDLMTLRPGEGAWSNRRHAFVILEEEQVKIKEAPDGRTCIFLGPGGDACLIYDHRPFACRILECWDPSRFDTLLKLPPLTRLGLIGDSHPLSQIVQQHQEKCDIRRMAQAVSEMTGDGGTAREKLIEMILYDLHVREFSAEKFGLPDDQTEFYFGRPLFYLLQSFGLKFRVDDDGRPELVRAEIPRKSGSGAD